MGKNYTAKTPPSDFKVTTPKNPLLSKQTVTSKGIPVPYTNLQLNTYPIPVTISHFQCMVPSTWLTNGYVDPSTWFNHQLEKDVSCKVLLFITRWRSWSCLVTKPYGIQTQQLLHKNDELGQILSLVTICLNKLCSTLVQLVSSLTVLKIIFLYV